MAGSKDIEARRIARKQAQEAERLRERNEAKRAAERAAREDEARREAQRVAKRRDARREALERERVLDAEAERRRIRHEALRASERREHQQADRVIEQRRIHAADAQVRHREAQARERAPLPETPRTPCRAAKPKPVAARLAAPRSGRGADDGRKISNRSVRTPRDAGGESDNRNARERRADDSRLVGEKRRSASDDRRKSADASRPGRERARPDRDKAVPMPDRDKPEKSRAAERADTLRQREPRAKKRAADAASPRADGNRTAVPRGRSAEPSGTPRLGIAPAAPAQRESLARDPLNTRIPSGRLSGALPWLQTAGNRLLTLEGDVVVLRGLDLPGLAGACSDTTALRDLVSGMTTRLLALLDWGVTLVRLPISRSLALDDTGPLPADGYLDAVDGLIATCAERGAYCLLTVEPRDVPGSAPSTSGNEDEPATPIAQTVRLWQRLGARYAGEPAVLFDLLAPPAPGMPPVGADAASAWERWRGWVRFLVAVLRDAHPRAVATIAGLDSARDLTGFPVAGRDDEPIPNLIYAAQIHPGDDGILRELLAFARRAPVLVTEWQIGVRPGPGQEMIAQILGAAGIGWNGTSPWDPGADNPGGGFLRESRGRFEPTLAGREMQRLLALGRAWAPAAADTRLQ